MLAAQRTLLALKRPMGDINARRGGSFPTGASMGGLGCTWAALGAYLGDLGPLLGLYWRSWPALGAAVCDPEPLSEPMLAVLGRSWVLCCRSWAALGACVRGLRPKTVKNMATLKMCVFPGRGLDLWPRGRSRAALGSYLGCLGPLLGPMLAVLGADQGLSWRSWPVLGPKWSVLGADQGLS